MPEEIQIGTWHHGPLHRLVPNTMYMLTASTLYKRHISNTAEKLSMLGTFRYDRVDVIDDL
jgi:hypothetical protein